MSSVIEKRLASEKHALQAALQAMTIDRDLWRDAHDDDCPNQAMLESTEAALSQAQEQVVRLQTTVGQQTKELEAWKKAVINLESSNGLALATISQLREEISQLQTTVGQLREELRSADEYSLALERLRRHKRAMRENKCPERDQPCWIDLADGSLGMDEICDPCLMRQVAHYFRGLAVKDVGKLRRKIDREARKRAALATCPAPSQEKP